MGNKIIVVIGFTVLVILVLFIVFDYKKKSGPGNQPVSAVSANVLYITQPATHFSGQVEKIEGNRLTVSLKQILMQTGTTAQVSPVAITGVPSPLPTPKIVTVTYQVVVLDKTKIYQDQPNINYLFKTATVASPKLTKLTIKDIKVGQYITVISQVDLRTLSGTVFETDMINLPPIINILNGQIISLEGNILTINESTLDPSVMAKEYRINITSDTEISRMTFNAETNSQEPPTPKPEKFAIEDLKKDMWVNVYTVEDVESQTLSALRIEPLH